MPTLIDIVNCGKLRGYHQDAPSIEAAEIDGAVCAQSECTNCGHAGMRYVPYVQDEGSSYVAYAVCPLCGEAREF